MVRLKLQMILPLVNSVLWGITPSLVQEGGREGAQVVQEGVCHQCKIMAYSLRYTV